MNKTEMQQEIEKEFDRKMSRLDKRQELIFSTLKKYNSLNDSVFIIQRGEQLKEIEMEAREARNVKAAQMEVLEELDWLLLTVLNPIAPLSITT